MDILDNLIGLAQISGGVHINCQLLGDWQLPNTPTANQAVAHIVHKGQAYLHFSNESGTHSERLTAGDIVFFAKPIAHSLSSDDTPNPTKVYPTPSVRQAGQFLSVNVSNPTQQFANSPKNDTACDLFCLHFCYESQAELIQNLPPMLVLHTQNTPLQAMIDLLKTEATAPNLGSSSVVNALTAVIFTLILRTFLANEQQKSDSPILGILKGWQEPRLQPLLWAIIENPEHDWHIAKMANLACLSRSQLIRLFNQHLGVSPHAFVHKIRLQKSAKLLRQSADSVLSVALSVGFLSETHFSKAFKKYYGTSPSQYRTANAP